VILNGAKTDAAAIDSHLDVVKFYADNDAKMRQILADGGIIIDAQNNAFINPAVDDPTKIDQQRANSAVYAWNSIQDSGIPQTIALSQLRSRTLGSSEWGGNLATDYRFRSGPLRGLRVGFGVNYRGGQIIGNRGSDTIVDPANPAAAIDDPRYTAADPVLSESYYTTTATFSYTVSLKETRRFLPKTVHFDLSIANLQNRRDPIYAWSTGSQNTSSTVFVPNNGSLSDPSRHAVAGNFFYVEPRNFTLTARMDF
jgi:hypothetical protein